MAPELESVLMSSFVDTLMRMGGKEGGCSGVGVVGAEWGGYLAWVIVVARHGVDTA